ncbi:MAG TPA: SRPBCC domain-containing protein [Acidimicrobiales bacterium]|nr:SRPBCC domain-containing protein [Acidimicrobiales bacterium]
MNESGSTEDGRRRLTLERTHRAALGDVWDLWTTKEGIESWWGPDGYSVTVRHLDDRVGGELRYTMTATADAQIEFMEQAGMPIATDMSIVYTEVTPMRRLSYTTAADFIPGTSPYEVATTVTFDADSDSVRMALTFDAMHDDQWTERSVQGRESELQRLDKILGG